MGAAGCEPRTSFEKLTSIHYRGEHRSLCSSSEGGMDASCWKAESKVYQTVIDLLSDRLYNSASVFRKTTPC